MRVVVPFTNLRPGVLKAIRDQGFEAETIDTSGGDYAYHDAIRGIWEDKESFVIIEHDVLSPPGSLDSMASCNELWCAVPYQTPIGRICALGHTKFDERLLRKPWPFKRTKWERFDRAIESTLARLGYTRHQHEFLAEHAKAVRVTTGFFDDRDYFIFTADLILDGMSVPDSDADFLIVVKRAEHWWRAYLS